MIKSHDPVLAWQGVSSRPCSDWFLLFPRYTTGIHHTHSAVQLTHYTTSLQKPALSLQPKTCQTYITVAEKCIALLVRSPEETEMTLSSPRKRTGSRVVAASAAVAGPPTQHTVELIWVVIYPNKPLT